MNDDELMDRVKVGDREALSQLYGRYNGILVGFLRKKTRDLELAEELAQEVWIKVQQSVRPYYSLGKFSGWLLMVARNLMVDAKRKAKLMKTINFDFDFGFDGLMAVQDGLESRMLSEQASRIERLLPELPDDQQTTFVLFAFCGMSLPEVAAHMGCPVATSKSRYRLAKEKLIERAVQLGYVADLDIALKYQVCCGSSVASAT